MYILVCLVRAFTLMRCALDPDYRERTVTRWRTQPRHLIVYEVGGGIMGLVLISLLVVWAVVALSER